MRTSPKQRTRRPTAAVGSRKKAPASNTRLALGGLLVAVLAGGVFVASRQIGASSSGNASAAPVIAHVHGLGINPVDGSLQVATHTGTFRITDDGPVQRVGGTAQDTMGFTVVGPNHFLGSGHPDAAGFRQGKPSRLGLIESTDAGETWKARSLSGEVDFHSLAASQGTTYGLDSGTNRLLASTDNTSWETRSTIKISGFAIDPAQVDHLVAAGLKGALDSTDGGRSWQPITGAPALVALSWAPGGTLWGADQSGATYRSTNAGSTWQQAGRVDGQPEALLATNDRLVIASAAPNGQTIIQQSLDAGATWQTRYQTPE